MTLAVRYPANVCHLMAEKGVDTPFDKDRTVSELKTLIEKRHGKAKGAAVLCLSKLVEQGKIIPYSWRSSHSL